MIFLTFFIFLLNFQAVILKNKIVNERGWDPMISKKTVLFLFREEVIKIIKNFCLEKKLDLATFLRLRAVSFEGKNRIHAENLALMAKEAMIKIRFEKSAKAAFFAGLMLHSKHFSAHSIKKNGGVDKTINNLLQTCTEGNIFIAHCVCLDHFLKEKRHGLKRKDFSCSDISARKLLKIIKIIGNIIAICDEAERLFGQSIKKEEIVKKLEEKFFGETKIIMIAIKEAEKIFSKNGR